MLVVRGQQPGAGRLAAAAAPLAAVVELADHARRAHAFLPVVELFLDLVLDQLTLFLDDQDFLEALGEAARAGRLERPGHRDLVDAQADLPRHRFGNAKRRKGRHRVAVGLAAGHYAEARARRVPNDPVERI